MFINFKHHIKQGVLSGFPRCCIAYYFVRDEMRQFFPKFDMNGPHYGYVACPFHKMLPPKPWFYCWNKGCPSGSWNVWAQYGQSTCNKCGKEMESSETYCKKIGFT